MPNTTITPMQTKILQTLYDQTYIGEKHTSPENTIKKFPKHLRGQAKTELQQLQKTELITTHPTGYGLQISLNPKEIEKIQKIIGYT